MNEIEWDIQKIKRLKKKLLVQFNLVLLLLFFLSVYYVSVGWSLSIYFGLCCLLLWILVVHTLYTLTTEKVIGTKTSRLVQAFDRNRWGKKRWKRKKATEAIIISILSAICTVLVFNIDLSVEAMGILNLWPFVGGWLVLNIGEIIRIKNL